MTTIRNRELDEQELLEDGAAGDVRPRVVHRVAKHIEGLTRFGIRDLAEVEPETYQVARVAVTLTQAAQLEIVYREGSGRLPSGVKPVRDREALDAELAASLERVETQIPQALQKWADDNPGGYRRLMPGGAAFLQEPGAIGHQYVCGTCEGDRVLGCGRCRQTGAIACQRCAGSCIETCPWCNGWFMNATCSACNGTGGYTSSEYVGGVHREVRYHCQLCRGTAKQICTRCDRGNIWCRRCGGSGNETCVDCGGRKNLDCGTCDAQGVRHIWGRVDSSMRASELSVEISLDNDDAKARNLVLRLDRDRLPQYGEMRSVQYSVSGHTLHTLHLLDIPVQRALIGAAGQVFDLHGFGAQVEVVDFRGIAGTMLRPDLAALEAVTEGKGPLRGSNDVVAVLSDFLRSPLNRTVAKATSKGDAADGAGTADVASADYLLAAGRALHGAIAHIYRNQVAKPAVAVAALSSAAALLMSWVGWPSTGWLAPAAAAATGGAVVWGATEILSEGRIRRKFEEAVADHVIARAHTSGSFMKWRLLALAGIVAGTLMGAWLPWKMNQSDTAKGFASAGGVMAFEQWQAQAPDVAARRFPERKQLQARAHAGDPDAQLMLAWGLTLGAGGIEKNVPEARRLSDKLPASPDTALLKAVITLHQDVERQKIVDAAAVLARAANAGVVEARYWHARTLLMRQSPIYNPARGIVEMGNASAQGHGRAALAAGRIHAEGNGTPRDVNLARWHLRKAQAAGLEEAARLLEKL